jgi:two-component system cell cycle sensor histidine kinase/response regulator CckA
VGSKSNSRRRKSHPALTPSAARRGVPGWLFLGLFVCFGAAVVGAGRIYYERVQAHTLVEKGSALAAIAALKAGQIAAWRRERLDDAALLQADPFLAEALLGALEPKPDPSRNTRVEQLLRQAVQPVDYERALLADAQGRCRLAAPGGCAELDDPDRASVREAFRDPRITLSDVHGHRADAVTDVVHMALAIPIRGREGQVGAVLVLYLDPTKFLFPLVQHWPMPGETAESVLLRRDGSDVVFLSEFRHSAGIPLALRFPLSRTELPAVQAALSERAGVVEGRDAWGAPVVVAFLPVAGTDWRVLCKVDLAEVRRPARIAGLYILLLGVALIAAAGTSLGLLWRRQRLAYYKAELELQHEQQADRDRAAQALRASEQRYRGLFATSPEAVVLATRADGRLLEVNESFTALTGYTREEAIGRTTIELRLWRDADERQKALGLLEKHGSLRNHETLVRKKSGELCHALVSLVPTKAGAEPCVVALWLDISARKRAEEELRESELRLRLTLEAAHLVAWEINPATGALHETGRVDEHFGRQEGFRHPTLEDFASSLHPEDRPRVLAALGRALRGEEGYDIEYRVPLADGAVRWLASSGKLVADESGQPTRLLGIARNITERKELEQALWLKNLAFDASIAANSTVNRDGILTEANAAFVRLWGYQQKAEVIGRPIQELLLRLEDMEAILAALDEVGEWEGEYEARKKDGSSFWAHSAATVLRDPDGKHVGYQSSVLDVSERKRQEVERQRLQEQLQQAMKMEAVGRLAGGVAHDFNNLLTSIKGNLELASMDLVPSSPLAEGLGQASRSAESAAVLTRQLLAFARRQVIEPRLVDLGKLVENLSRMLARLIGEDIRLTIKTHEPLWPVRVDPAQVEQVLVNLAVNARDAMPNGGTLAIEADNVSLPATPTAERPDGKGGDFVRLALRDTGQGMSDEVKKRLFEPFFTTKEQGRGTGLGLATTYGAVSQAGGFIDVASELGRGASFTLHFPRVASEGGLPDAAAGVGAPELLRGGSETVLLVEDEDAVRRVAMQLLGRLGYEVLQAADGDEALALARARKERIDLLLTDVVMPGMNGRQLAERLCPLHPETKVLYTSGYSEGAIAQNGALDEDVAFLSKPYTLLVLGRKLREVLDG